MNLNIKYERQPRKLKSVASGYWYRYGFDGDAPGDWKSYFVGQEPPLPSKCGEHRAQEIQRALKTSG